jgi:hypothetical protein
MQKIKYKISKVKKAVENLYIDGQSNERIARELDIRFGVQREDALIFIQNVINDSFWGIPSTLVDTSEEEIKQMQESHVVIL